ncbi:MAG: thioredoxin domain-containing protein [Balneolaceae bacterium]|nr:thioredoxin domain-containing protein [Balneolaceae bacterium]
MNIFTALKFALIALLLMCCTTKENKVSAQDNTNSDAIITIIEYSDYQCPACGFYHPIIEQVKEHFGDKVSVEYRDFPLNTHQYAVAAARAAEAARKQGKFKAMHDILFENQNVWSGSGNPQALFEQYARDIGLDMEQFKEDLNSAETQRAVLEEKKEGEQMGVSSTPTFFINGEKLVQNPSSFDQFKRLINLYMEEAESNN